MRGFLSESLKVVITNFFNCEIDCRDFSVNSVTGALSKLCERMIRSNNHLSE